MEEIVIASSDTRKKVQFTTEAVTLTLMEHLSTTGFRGCVFYGNGSQRRVIMRGIIDIQTMMHGVEVGSVESVDALTECVYLVPVIVIGADVSEDKSITIVVTIKK